MSDRTGPLRAHVPAQGHLAAGGRTLEEFDLTALAERIDGASPAYIKELLRRAALLTDSDQPRIVVSGCPLVAALAELGETGALSHRFLGFQAAQQAGDGKPTGYPPVH